MTIRQRLLVTVLLFITFTLSACGYVICPDPDEGVAHIQEYNQSLEALNSKTGHYKYTVTTSSWIGSRTKTVIEVKGGDVISRHFESYHREKDGEKLVSTYEENADNIGDNAAGAKPKTLKEVYEDCKREVLRQSSDINIITFQLDDEGLLKTCSYRMKGCQDDCSKGINISKIEFLNAK